MVLPVPSPDPALYESVLVAGFARFPERKTNYERYRTSVHREILDFLPIKLDVENVSRCNYHCTMCQVSEWPKMGRAVDMSFDSFTQVIDAQPGLIEIKIHGMGEPLLAAPDFFRMIHFARSRDLWVRSSTNGSLLHLKDNYIKLIDSDICEIQVSIDGATAPTYEAIRRGGTFKRIAANCEKLNTYATESGRNRTRMWVVVQRENFHELDLFPELAAQLGFTRLTLSLDLNHWGQDRWQISNSQIDMQQSFDSARAFDLIEKGRLLGVEVTFWFVDKKYDTRNNTTLCPWPFERAYISSDMRVVPCCMIANPTVSDIGDARELPAVWNGNTMRAFRRAHLEGNIPDFCKSCYAAN